MLKRCVVVVAASLFIELGAAPATAQNETAQLYFYSSKLIAGYLKATPPEGENVEFKPCGPGESLKVKRAELSEATGSCGPDDGGTMVWTIIGVDGQVAHIAGPAGEKKTLDAVDVAKLRAMNPNAVQQGGLIGNELAYQGEFTYFPIAKDLDALDDGQLN